jgi:hypothetical protein
MMNKVEIWLKGVFAAGISGAAGGMMTGLAAVGIDPTHFNLQAGLGSTVRIGTAAALINAVIGVAAYLQKSPLPEAEKRGDGWEERKEERRDEVIEEIGDRRKRDEKR